MPETRRKLTTIFSADVQDYTRLMRADEEGTVETLKRYRDAMGRLITAHGGRVVNTWGDGLIAEFPSVVEAVRAAIDVQNELAGYNAATPSGARMLYRIGINLGDVIAEGDDIYGDGVNVAARLQASAAAGGIVISSTVYDQVHNKVAVGFEFLGQLEVKNIDGGVPSYAVRIGATADGTRPTAPTVWQAPASEGPSGGPAIVKRLGVLAVIAAGLVAVNLLTWDDEFWAAWPVLALAVLAALAWIRRSQRIDRVFAVLALAGLAAIAANLLSWTGIFWAKWPLLGLAIAAAIRWLTGKRRNGG
ncbi:adenylate/guanylate cyclase domain-containing protein [Rhizobiaceae bacterium n13]|uniref:Adenylate/guanylate cyclase domain-containing protein n=1 Tax=Ferirhizobium litorale TaxID=2927786 RepID=A0AAE3U1X1_9HYPH|nr:adenylate/guanylate cyclase domain-containing protein [Fererhizobium litorale]MDI7860610.1 adenylate/guanylate cyclase domain-containing protein [Fererhizobium litorale]MDI7920758.1 adenylate/guanylate cyclase domain-containing protein [Fererhizobium litorale]